MISLFFFLWNLARSYQQVFTVTRIFNLKKWIGHVKMLYVGQSKISMRTKQLSAGCEVSWIDSLHEWFIARELSRDHYLLFNLSQPARLYSFIRSHYCFLLWNDLFARFVIPVEFFHLFRNFFVTLVFSIKTIRHFDSLAT